MPSVKLPSAQSTPIWVKALLCLVCAMEMLIASPHKAQCKLGEPFESYKARVAKNFTANGEKKAGPITNHMFVVQVDSKSQEASPGYALGVTISSVNGKITAQTMVIKPGVNPVLGNTMASIHAFAFAYEALGKTVPTDKVKAEDQFKAFSGAVLEAMFGRAQNVRYPGLAGLITLSRDPSGNLVVQAKL